MTLCAAWSWTAVAASTLLLLFPSSANAQEGSPSADLVLLNGKIITVDSSARIVEAVAVRSGRIVAVGSTKEVHHRVGPKTQVVDLKGMTATPGLIDAHIHLSLAGVGRITHIDLSYPGVRSVTDIVRLIAQGAAAVPRGTWIQGAGWDEGKLTEHRTLLASDLDSVSPQHPVFLLHTSGHYAVVNSVALRAAGIDRTTADPPGGTIDRTPDGRPTGMLRETAFQLVANRIPPPTPGQIVQGIRALTTDLQRECMTAVKDPLITEPDWKAYTSLHEAGELGVRVFVLWKAGTTVDSARQLIARIGAFSRPYESTGDDLLISGGVKLFMDGSAAARTAWVYDDWYKNGTTLDTGNHGYPRLDPDTLRQLVKLFHDAGLHIGIHAIGDRTIDWVVDTYAAVLAANPVAGRRHSIIHAAIPSDHALGVMARLQRQYDAGYPEASATFMWWVGDVIAGSYGPRRALRLDPFRTYLRRGIIFAQGSDYFVTLFAARYGLWASRARETLLGTYGKTPWGTAESIGIRDALKSYTIWAARQLFLETKIGSLEEGKYADIAVWDCDPTRRASTA